MNLVNGIIIDEAECTAVLENIEDLILKTLQKPALDVNRVINACARLVENMESLEIMQKLPELGINPAMVQMYSAQIKESLGGEAIRRRLEIELGKGFDLPKPLRYSSNGAEAEQRLMPVGVIFHITAGNVDGLPFLSLLEGLLTGNINIVKLPKDEGGITAMLLMELFKAAPELAEYVYVFDYSSKDIYAMKTLAGLANAIVVWGGDEAVSAVRRLAEPNTKIIEWGHKISFAYVSKAGINQASLQKLAQHICLTNQLFCSSCQGIFLEDASETDIDDFCKLFLPILEQASKEHSLAQSEVERLFIQAQSTLELYHQKLERRKSGKRIFKGKACSITACSNSKLEPSIMYRNPWVKPMLRQDILRLRAYKSYLQTVALICGEEEHTELAELLLKAGVVKISLPLEMSDYSLGEAHDGVFPLRSYTRIISDFK
ncbi:MAG: acyl-CoA reductase [Oscillospiraceae bacterium]|nr:acyl-CoA reductase [Oscillospiraceae bacterium]